MRKMKPQALPAAFDDARDVDTQRASSQHCVKLLDRRYDAVPVLVDLLVRQGVKVDARKVHGAEFGTWLRLRVHACSFPGARPCVKAAHRETVIQDRSAGSLP